MAVTFAGQISRRSRNTSAQPNPPELPDADYNVAPTTHQPIIRQSKDTGSRELILARWGLVPFFTKEYSLFLRSKLLHLERGQSA